MAFNFFGTFTRAQWFDFRDFASVQRVELEARKRWTKAELTRTGVLACTYSDDNSTPISFQASPKTYIGKLLLAYRMLGGVPEHDMLLRNRSQAVFLNQGVDTDDIPAYSNGRVPRGDQRFDRTLGLSVEAMKNWQLEAIKAKREHLEFKIKRALDYSDQLEQELEVLSNLIDSIAIDEQVMTIENTISQPDRYNIPSGVGDRFGNSIGRVGDGSFSDAGIAAATGNERVPQG